MNTKDALRMAVVAIDGIDLIQRLTKFGGAGATSALASISNVAGLLQAGAEGKLTSAEVASELLEMRDRLADNDSAADAELMAKFDNTDG